MPMFLDSYVIFPSSGSSWKNTRFSFFSDTLVMITPCLSDCGTVKSTCRSSFISVARVIAIGDNCVLAWLGGLVESWDCVMCHATHMRQSRMSNADRTIDHIRS